MMKEPWFWHDNSHAAKVITTALSPLAFAYNTIQQQRIAHTRPFRPDAATICIGNATVGGVGKTPFAIALSSLLSRFSPEIFFLTRGYGGVNAGPLVVDANTSLPNEVGDETLLLAKHARTIKAHSRPRGARVCCELGADLIIMDDGFQNPSLAKDVSILLLASDNPSGNGKVFPAGPLREPVSSAVERADIVVFTGEEENDISAEAKPVFRATLRPTAPPPQGPLMAFCGIGRPYRFFDLLERNGGNVVDRTAFPDHHFFSDAELSALRAKAKAASAQLITTEKDFIRISDNQREGLLTFAVEMTLRDEATFIETVVAMLDARAPAWRKAQ